MKHGKSAILTIPAIILALTLAACAPPQDGTGNTAVQNGVIVDDLRSPRTRDY